MSGPDLPRRFPVTDPELLDLLPHGVVVVDAGRRITGGNLPLWRLTGYPPEKLIGRPWPEALDGRVRGAPAPGGWHPSARLRSVRALPEQELTIRNRAGSEVPVAVSGSYRRQPDGALAGAVLVVRDAGRRPPGHTGLELVSTVSHELRSPITAVKGYIRLLLGRWPELSDDHKQAMLREVGADVDRMARLISELLDVSRLECHRLVLCRRPTDLARLAADVARRVESQYPELEAHLDFPHGLPHVSVDADKIERVLLNLVENACRHGAPKGVSITGTAGRHEVALTVADEGAGIPDGEVRNVFDKFFRGGGAGPASSGLGLWISRGLVEAHGGRLVVDPNGGRGTVFRFTLPIGDREALDRT